MNSFFGTDLPGQAKANDISFLSHQSVIDRCIAAELVCELEHALHAEQSEPAIVPPKSLLFAANGGAVFLSMPALCHKLELFITKVGTVFPRNLASSLPTTQALVVAFSTKTGQPIGVLDGSAITAIKCAAVTTLVTSRCASPDATVLAILGAGAQAHLQLQGVLAARPIKQLRIYNRSEERLKEFVAHARKTTSGCLEIVECSNANDAIRGADIIGTATACSDPLAQFSETPDWVHINCVGAHTPVSREVPHSLLRDSCVIVEHVQTAVREAGDVHRTALDLPGMLHHAPDALQTKRTIFSSTGYALLDLVAVAHVLRLTGRPDIQR